MFENVALTWANYICHSAESCKEKKKAINQHRQPFWIKDQVPGEEASGCMGGRERESEWLYGCVREILELAEEVISVGHHRREGGREMETERRRRRRWKTSSLSHHVCGCYCDISSLEEQLETVSTATEQPDTPALTTTWFLESSPSLADTGTQQRKYDKYNPPWGHSYSRSRGHPITAPLRPVSCPFLCVCLCC